VKARLATVAALAAAALLAPRTSRANEEPLAPPVDAQPTAGSAAPTEPDARVSDFHVLVSSGASYRSIFALPVESWNLGLGAGFDISRHVAFYLRGTYERGRTPAGLDTQYIQLGASLEGVFGPLRPGVGVDLPSYFGVRRISDGTWDGQAGVGLFALLGLDLVRFDGHALFAAVRLDVDLFAPDWSFTTLVGGQGVLGLRW
jgi:hypothetical protein